MNTLVVTFDSASARPLDAYLRRDMESAFRADFGSVRIHTGPLAAAAARALRADAFTAGRDIFFAAGRFAPETAEGRALLAHELAHVLQQSCASARGLFALGAAGDPQEQRAWRLAEEALGGGCTTAVVRDHGRIVRRAVVVHEQTASIDVDFAGASPDTFVDTAVVNGLQMPMVTLHLTRNFVPGRTENIAAWTATGRVDVTVGLADSVELPAWDFGFIQFMEIQKVEASYAGKAPTDGGIVLRYDEALGQKFGRDAAGQTESNPPWTRANTKGDRTVRRQVAENRTEDHPQLRILARMHNFTTTYENFLFRVTDKRRFFVLFSARRPQPDGAFRHLAHFEVKLVSDFDVVWRNVLGDPMPIPRRRAETEIKFGPVALGAPEDPLVKKFLADPTTAQRMGTAELSGAVIAASRPESGPPAKVESKLPTVPPPADFFR